VVGGNKFYYIPSEKSYLHYGKDYALIYQGDAFLKTLNHVVSAHYGAQLGVWRKFLKQKQFKNEHLVIYANWDKLKRFDIQTAMFAHDSDSLGFKLKSYIKKRTPLYFSLKKSGLSYSSNLQTERLIDVHLDVTEFKKQRQDSVYVQLLQLSRKIGFPFERFMASWNGDLVYQEGGKQVQEIRYIETLLDEDFNETEVERLRYDTVPGFAVLASMNNTAPFFIGKLMQKGLLREEDNGYRFLFSPLLHFQKTGPYYQYYSATTAPPIVKSNQSQVLWKYKGTKYYFKIDKITRYEIFGSLQVPVRTLLRRNKLI
jgi:hypothetical protein